MCRKPPEKSPFLQGKENLERGTLNMSVSEKETRPCNITFIIRRPRPLVLPEENKP